MICFDQDNSGWIGTTPMFLGRHCAGGSSSLTLANYSRKSDGRVLSPGRVDARFLRIAIVPVIQKPLSRE